MRRCIKTGLDISFGQSNKLYRSDLYELSPGVYEARVNPVDYAEGDSDLVLNISPQNSNNVYSILFYTDTINRISAELLEFFKEWEPVIYETDLQRFIEALNGD